MRSDSAAARGWGRTAVTGDSSGRGRPASPPAPGTLGGVIVQGNAVPLRVTPAYVASEPPLRRSVAWQGDPMDALDGKVIGCLLHNARATFAEIGAEVGLSAPAVKRRVDRLVASGAIRGFTALIDPDVL